MNPTGRADKKGRTYLSGQGGQEGLSAPSNVGAASLSGADKLGGGQVEPVRPWNVGSCSLGQGGQVVPPTGDGCGLSGLPSPGGAGRLSAWAVRRAAERRVLARTDWLAAISNAAGRSPADVRAIALGPSDRCSHSSPESAGALPASRAAAQGTENPAVRPLHDACASGVRVDAQRTAAPSTDPTVQARAGSTLTAGRLTRRATGARPVRDAGAQAAGEPGGDPGVPRAIRVAGETPRGVVVSLRIQRPTTARGVESSRACSRINANSVR